MALEFRFCCSECVSFIVVMLPNEAEHKEIASLISESNYQPVFSAKLHEELLTLWIAQPAVARVQKTPVTIEPLENADMVLMMPADPVLGMPMRL